MPDNIAELFSLVAADLRIPAGDSPLYATAESIQKNLNSFIPTVHDTWKRWHFRAIEEILTFDSAYEADKRMPIKGPFREFTHYVRQLWRKVNDSIIWSMAGERRHFVKRLCLYRRRGLLTEANPKTILKYLDYLNKDPYSIAIWNDATTCVDIGDISFFHHGNRDWHFIEVKEGSVNDELGAVMKTFDNDNFYGSVDSFISRYGIKGKKQLERCVKQSTTNSQAMELLNKEEGIDPVTSMYLKVVELVEVDEFYDDQMKEFIDNAIAKGINDTLVVDGCLWIYVKGQRTKGEVRAPMRFVEYLRTNNDFFRLHSSRRIKGCDMGGIRNLNDSLMMPMAKPLFIRYFTPTQIGEIALGKMMNNIYLFLDMEMFGALLEQNGAAFSWSTPKEARRLCAKPAKDRHSIVYFGRKPQYQIGDVVSDITEPLLTRMLFDGLRPSVMAKQMVESSQYILDHVAEFKNIT